MLHEWLNKQNVQNCAKKDVFNYIAMMTKMTLLASLAIASSEVVLCQDNPSVEVSHDNFYF